MAHSTRRRPFSRVPLIVIPGFSHGNNAVNDMSTDVDTSIDDDEPLSSNSSNQSSEMSPQESLSSNTAELRSRALRHAAQQPSPFVDSGVSDLQQGYLGENETPTSRTGSHNNRVLFTDMTTPTPRRSIRRREGSAGSIKSRSSSSSRRSRITQSLHLDDPVDYAHRHGSSERSRRSFGKVYDSPLGNSTPVTDNSSESSRGDSAPSSPSSTERQRYPRRYRHIASPPPSPLPPKESMLKKRLGGVRLMLWTLFVAAATSTFMLFSTNRTINKQVLYPHVFDYASEPHRVIQSRRNSLMPSESGLRGKLVQGLAGKPLHALSEHKYTVDEDPADHQPDKLQHKKHDKHFDTSQAKQHERMRSKPAAKPDSHHAKDKGKTKKDKPAIVDKHHAKKPDKHPDKPKAKSSGKTTTGSSSVKYTSVDNPLRVFLPASIGKMSSSGSFDWQDKAMYVASRKRSDSKHRRHGRTIALSQLYNNGSDDNDYKQKLPKPRKIKEYPADFTDNTQFYPTLDSDDERLSHMEIRPPYSEGECVPMQDWQTTYNPSCNGMHELQFDSLGANTGEGFQLFGTKGFWRNAWKLDLHGDNEQDTVVLKTLRYVHNFEDAHFEHDRVDAVAMERLTSSPHVIDIFGFCGHSVMTEYADGVRLGQLADKAKKKPLERLRIARDIAQGLADVHGIDGDGNATFVHLDINPANVVSVGGTLKLNDFNIGIIRRWNTTSQQPCGFPAQYPNPQWRSPEEARNEQNLTEKVDVFSMGHIFFRMICGHEPWNKLEPNGKPEKDEINDKVKRGVLPFIPKEVMESKDKEVVAIRDVMMKCYTYDPKKRPSARDIANRLDKTLKDLQSKV